MMKIVLQATMFLKPTELGLFSFSMDPKSPDSITKHIRQTTTEEC